MYLAVEQPKWDKLGKPSPKVCRNGARCWAVGPMLWEGLAEDIDRVYYIIFPKIEQSLR